jgi:hypothetical protein
VPQSTTYFFPIIRAQKPGAAAICVTEPRHFGQTVDNLPATDCGSSLFSGQTAPQFGLLQRYWPPFPGLPSAATGGASSGTGAASEVGSARRRGKARPPGLTGGIDPPDCEATGCDALTGAGIVSTDWQPGQLISIPAADSSILMGCLQCEHSKRISIIPNYIVRRTLAK